MNFRSFDEYHAAFPVQVRLLLDLLRILIRRTASRAEEGMHCNIPVFVMEKTQVHHGACTRQVALHPTSSPMKTFVRELAPNRTSKGANRSLSDKPLPAARIKSIVRYRVREIKAPEKSLKGCTMRRNELIP